MSKSDPSRDDVEKARAHMQAGDRPRAMAHLVKAIIDDPRNQDAKRLFTGWMKGMQVAANFDVYGKVIQTCLVDDTLQRASLTMAWNSVLPQKGGFAFLKDTTALVDYETFLKRVQPARTLRYLGNTFFRAGMSALRFTTLPLENLATFLRRFLLENRDLPQVQDALPLVSSLGLHMFHNEYVNQVSPGETTLLAVLSRELESGDGQGRDLALALAVYGCYAPLVGLANIQDLVERADGGGAPEFDQLLYHQVSEPLEEREIEKNIPVLTPINDTVSAAVREQYEEYPYPRWQSWVNTAKPNLEDQHGRTILNAGCGTGQSPISMASLYPGAEVIGVDLSRASLAYAQRMARKLEVSNLSFHQADILELKNWDQRFDVVMSTGVLHHMEDPLAGWRVLASLLKPGGVMQIGLYSEIARQPVVAARRWVADNGIPHTREGIGRFREHVLSCDADDPLADLRNWADLYTLSSCRDMVFHVMEHRFTCPRIKEVLDELELEFLGFMQLPQRILNAYDRMFPDDPQQTNLDHWHEFEQKYPRTFWSMYVFWCCRKDERPDSTLPSWMQV